MTPNECVNILKEFIIGRYLILPTELYARMRVARVCNAMDESELLKQEVSFLLSEEGGFNMYCKCEKPKEKLIRIAHEDVKVCAKSENGCGCEIKIEEKPKDWRYHNLSEYTKEF